MTVAYTAPGVYIQELPSASRAIVGVSTSRTAFVGRALRGPVNEPTLVDSFAAFERRFGGLWAASSLSFAVQQFFQNGGSEALIVRVVNLAPDVADPPLPAPPTPDPGAKVAFAELPRAGSGVAVTLEAPDAGVWGNRLRARVTTRDLSSAEVSGGLFHLQLSELDAAGSALASESHTRVTLTPNAPRALDRVLASESALARVRGALAAAVPQPHAGTSTSSFAGGADGDPPRVADLRGNEAGRTGLYALLQADLFNLLCIPLEAWSAADTSVTALWNDATRLCEQRRAFLLVDPPQEWGSASAAAAAGALLPWTRSANAAVYFPRVRVSDALQEGRLRSFPPSGVVAGTIARIDAQRGVWKSPAGNEAKLLGVSELEIKLTDIEQGELNRLGINALRQFPIIGCVVWGARTLHGSDAQASQWKYISVRRLALQLHESLYRGTQWAVFEPNDEPLWAQLRLGVGSFLHQLFRQGAFAGKSAREAYFVKADRDTTTQADIERGVVNVIVGFAPLRPAEFVIIKLQQMAAQSA